MGYQTVKSVKKALAILELVHEYAGSNRYVMLQEVAAKTGILPVTARNLLRTLEECGYVLRSGHGRYECGPRSFELLRSGGMIQRVIPLARPILERAAAETGEAFMLVTLANGKRVELIRVGADSGMRYQANEELYLMRTARVILAWYPVEQLDYFLEHYRLPAPEEWPETGGTREGLNRVLKAIRRDGGCNETTANMAALAVPLLSTSDEILGSLGCYAPLERTDLVRRTGIYKLLHDYADEIRSQL